MKRGGILERVGVLPWKGGFLGGPATCTPPSGRGVSSTQLSPVPWLFVGGRPRCLKCLWRRGRGNAAFFVGVSNCPGSRDIIFYLKMTRTFPSSSNFFFFNLFAHLLKPPLSLHSVALL